MKKLLPARKIAHLSVLLLFMALADSTVAQASHKKAHTPVAASGAASTTSASAPLDSSIPLEVWNNPAWQHGPVTVQLGQVASLVVPAGFRYLPPPPAQADQHATQPGGTLSIRRNIRPATVEPKPKNFNVVGISRHV